MTRETRRTEHSSGAWSEQEYQDGELHGTWRVFFADGTVNWEREYRNGEQHGPARTYARDGSLVEERWFADGELHGPWMRMNADGTKTTRDFRFGYRVDHLHAPTNPDFRESILPLLDLEPEPTHETVAQLLAGLAKPSIRFGASEAAPADAPATRSYLGRVDIIGEHESWPEYEGQPLSPILQLVARDLPLRLPPWDSLDAVTVFAIPDDVPGDLGSDIVVRGYRSLASTRRLEPREATPVCAPRALSFESPVLSYPDENDLPPRLRTLLRRDQSLAPVLDAEEALQSRISGWPGWIQSSRVFDFPRFAFQLDSLNLEHWQCGDCTIHYFFFSDEAAAFEWTAEMT